MSQDVLGIDIAKDKFDVALLRAGQYQSGTFSNDTAGFERLSKWLKKVRANQLPVCLEATGHYGEEVALFLHEAGYCVSVVNPARVKAYAASQLKRNKTDKEDAKVIAHFCATQQPEVWSPPSPAQRELQALSRRVETLKADRQQELNRKQSGQTSALVLQTIEAHLTFLDTQIVLLEQQIADLIDHDDTLKQQEELLTSIPGLGHTSAAKFLAEVPDVSQFQSAAQLAAYAGLTPSQRTSGSSVHKPTHLSKTGNTHLRTLFFMPALTAIRHNPIIQALVARLEARGKSRMVIVGAVMRKLLHLAYGVLKTGIPFDPNYLVNVPDTA